MKQHITIEQLNELNKERKEKLMSWSDGVFFRKAQEITPGSATTHWHIDKNYLLSIGQMIEFLMEKSMGDYDLQIIINSAGSSIWRGIGTIERSKLNITDDGVPELCDALWEAIKEVLEK